MLVSLDFMNTHSRYHLFCELCFRRQGRWIGKKEKKLYKSETGDNRASSFYLFMFLYCVSLRKKRYDYFFFSLYTNMQIGAANNLLISPLVWELPQIWENISNDSVIHLLSKYEYFIGAQSAKPALRQIKKEWKNTLSILP